MASSIVRPLTLAAWVITSLIVPAGAQTPDTPPVPRLTATPDHYTWTITYKYAKTDDFPAPTNPREERVFERLRKAHPRYDLVRVTKAGEKKMEVVHYIDGSDTIKCIAGDVLLSEDHASRAKTRTTSFESHIRFKDDFYNLDWVNRANYLGRQRYQGTECWVYTGKPNADTDEQTVYVDVKTGYPLAIQTPEALLTYSYKESTAPVDFPPHLDVLIKERAAGVAP